MGKDDAKKAAKAKRQEKAALKAGAVAKKVGDDTVDLVAIEVQKAAGILDSVVNLASSKAAADATLAAARNTTGVLSSNPLSKDLKITAFSLAFHGKRLIEDTLLELSFGNRYGLIGANGSGKSTFLTSLASRELPIPDHIDIFHLDEEAETSDRTALEAVIDVVRQKVEALEALAEHMVETAGPEADVVQDIYDRIDRMNPNTFEVRATEILMGLGFSRDFMAKKTKDLSGGWRMRVALSRALLSQPAMLLLDEPTNHLDMESCVWLEEELAKYPGILVMVSHSQDFMNGVCTNMIHLTQKQKFVYYHGNYDTFVKTKQENEINQMRRYEKEQADIKHLKEFISSCGTYSNLVKQAQSKQKIIDKMVDAGLTEKVDNDRGIKFHFPDCGGLPPPVLAIDNVSFAYSGKKEDLLYWNLELSVDLDSRIAIIGPNGAGKSTLLKLMFGDLTPTVGEVKKHTHLRIAKYHQHSTDQLELDLTPLEYMAKMFPEKKLELEAWRTRVGRFGVSGDMQSSPIRGMSDGQKSRLVFAYIAECSPHILFLDEPTNHLDMESIDSLAEAINEFKGGLVLVSHDFRLIGKVAKEVWLCENKKVDVWKGDILEYKKRLHKEVQRKLKLGLTTPQ
mmetsp:Transcript_1263/g.2726  ORF Transcript_1263/g.2726 Transcript_1263/m.2726 type:complete len:624 (+) Transcript_1263:96-1967(+)|eukprot:CAMPEP_0173380702 /NCGR_PEP_ID=MMETSP1356-20130122/3334_1 /TAXON_ID=77927 ORGANISM="Hemiselmis virescens, Strain PCC157" /NCGR_SAMPLE_ID=MMETSP1356 /ASSEMBLY_ACC=CAM_ASM_000847 /LENGTH=623 /DNA_ID=CAMNT_0014334395 /DNA_START=91 /DNA_END=1962 /DNA_ORIENTATION=+